MCEPHKAVHRLLTYDGSNDARNATELIVNSVHISRHGRANYREVVRSFVSDFDLNQAAVASGSDVTNFSLSSISYGEVEHRRSQHSVCNIRRHVDVARFNLCFSAISGFYRNIPTGFKTHIERFWKERPTLNVVIVEQSQGPALHEMGCFLINRTITETQCQSRRHMRSMHDLSEGSITQTFSFAVTNR